jgi:hypothetical protein
VRRGARAHAAEPPPVQPLEIDLAGGLLAAAAEQQQRSLLSLRAAALQHVPGSTALRAFCSNVLLGSP